MKKLNLLFTTVFLVSTFLLSCSSDDNGNSGESENNQISIEQITNGVTIAGAKLETGTPPSPTGLLNFEISKTEQDGFLNNGFNISFASTGQIKGAYIQFKDVNGNNSNGYYDVPKEAFGNSDGVKISSINGKKKVSLRTKINGEGDLQINVDFKESVPVGKFCYAICIYDANGNISQVEEVCVQVNSWGGNSAIVGEWIFDREEPADIENGATTTIECENGNTLTDVAYNMEEKDEWVFVLNEDGTYYETYDEKGKRLDAQASSLNCTAVYTETYEYKDKYSGNWSYDNEKKTITVVDFKYEDLINAAESEEYPDGSVYFEAAKIEIIAGELVITDSYNDGNITVTEKIIFKRK
ncbi:hypothetical protein [Aquimarina muelleri]|uniref:Uncharacterized protein n=1 Tax=Aquimarina muelleri TaxID=279356 RepID=A0A918JSE4_9FLAO|nr:hypothetical protein [Aquimarina muelleri]MCX2761658.1 hypothetical protein [Aquimarina muelleri]GGX07286.1 hypothetical protein GCM10007384_06060 [Aquimarina muelleri]